jgi:hypothetical protein
MIPVTAPKSSTISRRYYSMRKLMSLMLGLSLLTGVATVAFGQDDSKKDEKKKKKKKKGGDDDKK